ncbi:MAG: ribonuclease H family protein [Tissierellia bacterium]|nr:ribonuclease H family protein [Tissierellia bacterium]
MKYYAVKNGRKNGIYTSWNECKEQVEGFKGAIYKSFKTKKESYDFLEDKDKEIEIKASKDIAISYVDGSFNLKEKIYGAGVVFFDEDNIIEESKTYSDEFYIHRNVVGELMASEIAIDMAIAKHKKKIIIYHDYQGISSWANGEWKTNNKLTQNYKKFIEEKRKEIEIAFVKVKGHSNDKYNDLADSLAKKAANIE